MKKPKKITLKEAREKGELDKFVKEHEGDSAGDADKLDATLKSAVKPIPPQKKEQPQKK